MMFPYHGVLGQAAEARGKHFDATIGIALEDDRTPMRLQCDDCSVTFDPKEVYPYAPGFGVKKLRESWMNFLREKNPSLQSRTSVPVVTSGLTQALSVAGYLFLDAGDEVIIPEQYWDNYEMIFEQMYGACLRFFNTFKGDGFDTNALANVLKQVTGERAIVLLNFPNNPTGYTVTKKEANDIVRILQKAAERRPLIVLIDDAYFGLVYEEGIYTESLFARLANLHENLLAVKIDGATKEDFVWGHRVGFITFSRKGMTEEEATVLADKAAGVVRATVSNAPHISQSWLTHLYATASYNAQKRKKFEILKGRYQKVKEVLQNKKYKTVFHALPFNSGYFMCLELGAGLDAESVRKLLLEKFDTGVIAIGDRMLRIAYSSVPEGEIEQVFENIYQACISLRVLQHA